jgi:hypothetical protein
VSTRVKRRRVSYPFVESNIGEIPSDATTGVHVIPGPRLRRTGAHPIRLDPITHAPLWAQHLLRRLHVISVTRTSVFKLPAV